MSKLIIAILSLALFVNAAFAAAATPVAGTNSFTSGSFMAAPVKVFDVTNATDKTNWAPNTLTKAIFGPGTDNTTSWAYGVTYSSSQITGLVARKINNTMATSGNDTAGTELSVTGTDAAAASLTIAINYPPALAVGNGYLAAVSSQTSASTQSLVISVWAAGATAATSTTIVTAAAADTSTATTDYSVASVWYEDGYFYVLYTLIAGSGTSSVTTWTETGIYLQAIGASNASKLYTAPQAVASSLTATLSAAPRSTGATASMAKGGPSNYTMSTWVYVVYKAGSKIIGVPVNRSSGAASSSTNTLTTDVAWATTTGLQMFTPAGVWYTGNGTYGALISNQSQAAAATQPSTYTYSLTSCNGSTCADSGMGVFSSAATGSSNMIYGVGVPTNTTGYTIVAWYTTTTSGTTGFSSLSFNSTGSATATSTTALGTLQGGANFFRDSINNFWLGYWVADTANSNTVYSGYLGEVKLTLISSTTFGNALASFLGLLTLLLASLLAF
jgi:hypothetical protein